MKLSLDHIHIQSSDPDATKAFLAKMFDATDEWVIDFGAAVITRMHLAGNHINIFHRAPTTEGARSDGRGDPSFRDGHGRFRRGGCATA